VVPLVKPCRQTGRGTGERIVAKALAGLYSKYGEKWWNAQEAHNLGENMASAFEELRGGGRLGLRGGQTVSGAFEVTVRMSLRQVLQRDRAPERDSC